MTVSVTDGAGRGYEALPFERTDADAWASPAVGRHDVMSSADENQDGVAFFFFFFVRRRKTGCCSG